MRRRPGLLAAALRRVRAAVLLPLLGGNLLLFVAAVLALLIPDSHGWQLLLSFLLALGLISGLLLWNALAMRRLRAWASTVPLWTAALLLGAWLLPAILLFHGAGFVEPAIETRAGYWNSQLSNSMRHLLTYERLVTLQQVTLNAFRWVLLPALLLPFAIETATFGLDAGALGRAFRVSLSRHHWGLTIMTLGVAGWLVPKLAAWHPAHTVSGETVSAVLRLSVAASLAIIAAVLLIAVDAELLHSRDPAEPGERA